MSMLVFVFGDSIAWGLYDDRGGWVGEAWDGRSRLVSISEAIYQFDAYWHVPQPPSGHDGQTIFLFSALQPNGVASYPLAQPVLQWGNAADGGGAYWTLNSWI